MAERRPRTIASFDPIDTGTHRSLDFSIRESGRGFYAEIRGVDLRDEDRIPTDRTVTCPVSYLRALQRRVTEMVREAVRHGLLPDGGAE